MVFWFIKIFISFLVLIYASYNDLRNRMVPNKSWLIIYPVTVITDILSFYLDPDLQNIVISIVSILIAVGIGFLCFYFDFLGGGDIKTFIAISLFCPTFVFSSESLFYPFLPLSTLVNSLFLLLIINLCLFLQNLFRWFLHIPQLFYVALSICIDSLKVEWKILIHELCIILS